MTTATASAEAVGSGTAVTVTSQPTETRGTSYAARAGIEGTPARGVRRCRLRRTRYRGKPKVHLGHILTATGLNFVRLGERFADRSPRRAHRPPIARLLAEPVAA